jgi:predicted alpha/beta hydrolase
MNARVHTVQSSSGSVIPVTIREPAGEPRGVVQINTGTCIPQKIYWKFAEFLTKNGYITLTYDYSDADNYSSHVSHTAWVKDMESVFEFVMKEYPSLKKIVVGHSSGGQLIGYMSNCDKIDKIYLVACANGYIKFLSFPMQLVMRFFWNVVVPFSVRKYGYMNNKLFGTNGGFPKNIILELRSWCFQPDFFLSWFASKNVAERYAKIKNPVKAYQFADDVIANERSCRYIFELYKNAPRAFEVLQAKDYGMKKFGHRGFFHPSAEKKLWPEILKEINAD